MTGATNNYTMQDMLCDVIKRDMRQEQKHSLSCNAKKTLLLYLMTQEESMDPLESFEK